MKTILYAAAVTAGMLLLSGCLVCSLNPHYAQDAVVDIPPELVGLWAQFDPEDQELQAQPPWVFGEESITTFCPAGGSGTLAAVYFKVGDQLFTDTTPAHPDEQQLSPWWTLHTLPLHLLCRVSLVTNHMVLTPLDLDWFRAALADGRVDLPQVDLDSGDSCLVTADPEAWMGFLEEYGHSAEAFSTDRACAFVRADAATRPAKPAPAPLDPD